jgi:hypothetical protein
MMVTEANKTEKLKRLLKIDISSSQVRVGTILVCVEPALDLTVGQDYEVNQIDGVDELPCIIKVRNDKGVLYSYSYRSFNIKERHEGEKSDSEIQALNNWRYWGSEDSIKVSQ